MQKHIRAAVIVVILGVLGVWGFQSYMNSRGQDSSIAVKSLRDMEKSGAPNFSFTDLNGEKSELQQNKGKVIVLNFWASWCGPCVEEVPSLIKLVKEFKGDVELIAVSGDSSRGDIEVFLKSFPELKSLNIRIVWDEDRSIMKMFDVTRLPESLVLDKDLKVAKKIVGSIDWYNSDSIAYVKGLLSK